MNAPPPSHVLEAFRVRGAVTIDPLSSGHIHAAWRVTTTSGERCVIQRVNSTVFPDVQLLVRNAQLITDRLRAAGLPTLALLESAAGSLIVDDGDAHWRAYWWIDGRSAAASDPDDVDNVASAFGAYAAALRDVDVQQLRPTIDAFHDLDSRVEQLHRAVRHDPLARLNDVRDEVDRCRRVVDRLRSQPERSAWLAVPDRIAHNDAKLANAVMLDKGRVCIVDLDTTMPGVILTDIGELIRSCTGPAARAGRAAAAPHPERVDRVVRAWLRGWDAPLDSIEVAALPLAGATLTLENAVRFLADYLDGDRYFRVSRPDDNLVRFRSQLAHAQIQLDVLDDVRHVVEKAARHTR